MAMASENMHTLTDDGPQHYISPSYMTLHICRSSLHFNDGIKMETKLPTA